MYHAAHVLSLHLDDQRMILIHLRKIASDGYLISTCFLKEENLLLAVCHFTSMNSLSGKNVNVFYVLGKRILINIPLKPTVGLEPTTLRYLRIFVSA